MSNFTRCYFSFHLIYCSFCEHCSFYSLSRYLKSHEYLLFHVVVDGGWGRWAAWTRCSTTCGLGTQLWTRTCTSPAPSNNETACVGASGNTRKCYVKPCLGDV